MTSPNKFEDSAPVFLKDVVLDYHDLFKPAPSQDAKKKDNREHDRYSVTVIFEPGSEAYNTALAGVREAATKMWGPNAGNVVKSISKNSLALRDGNANLDKSGNVKTNYVDMKYVVAKNKAQPQIVGPAKHNGKFINIGEDGKGYQDGLPLNPPPYEIKKPYRGCRVNVKLVFTAGQQTTLPDGTVLPAQVFCRVDAVQFKGDGDAFGRGATSAEGFEDEEVETSTAAEGSADDFAF